MTRQINHPKPRTVSTVYFIGVTTTQSSIMKVFPRWSGIFGLGAKIVGYDAPIHSPAKTYRSIVRYIKEDPLSMGRLKVKIFVTGRSFRKTE